MNANSPIAVPAYFGRLSENLALDRLDKILCGLAKFFDAQSIGANTLEATAPEWVHPPQAAPAPFPWHEDADLKRRLLASMRAEGHQNTVGKWLICQAGQDAKGQAFVVWAIRPAERGWTETDTWGFQFAAQALACRHADSSVKADAQRRLELAATVTCKLSHDFGNYLTGIMGFTELSMLQLVPGSAPHRYLEEVLQAARQGADWLRRLHLFCGRNPVTCWPTHVSGVLAEEEARLRAAGATGVRFVSELPADLPLVTLDAGSLQIILAELVNNAQEAVKGTGTIRFAARVAELSETDCQTMFGAVTPGSYVELSVADDGPGLTPENHARLFREMFFATKPKHRGLGLLVVYGILQRFHGGMRFEASPPGEGATVSLYLPIAAIDAAPRRDAPNVLLAIPDRHLVESMRTILEASGYLVRVAMSPQDAVSAYTARGQAFALVIADAQAPLLPGLDLARRILERDEDANFVFVMTQASLHGLAEEELLKTYPLYYWPMEPRSFLKAVETSLARTTGQT